jgi:hypothetical protein
MKGGSTSTGEPAGEAAGGESTGLPTIVGGALLIGARVGLPVGIALVGQGFKLADVPVIKRPAKMASLLMLIVKYSVQKISPVLSKNTVEI